MTNISIRAGESGEESATPGTTASSSGATRHTQSDRRLEPIETVPKMQTVLLFAVTDIADDGTVRNWKMATGFWHTGRDDERSKARGYTPWEWDGHQVKTYDHQPTHWMPLPSPPEELN